MDTAKVEVGDQQRHWKAVVPQDFAVPERFAGKSAVE
jgi:hypothetical protein